MDYKEKASKLVAYYLPPKNWYGWQVVNSTGNFEETVKYYCLIY